MARKKKEIPGVPHRFPPPDNARQLREPRTVRTREGWARYAETEGYDWAAQLRDEFLRQSCDKAFFTLQDSIAGGFNWSKSKEGYLFWREVYREAGGEINTDLIVQRLYDEETKQLKELEKELEKAKANEGTADHLGI